MINLSNPVNRDHPLNQNLLNWWKVVPGLDGGKQLFDLMGLNHGTLNGTISWQNNAAPGSDGSLLLGGTAYIDTGVIPGFTYTISCWFRVPSSNQLLIFAACTGGGFFYLTLSSHTIQLFIADGPGGTFYGVPLDTGSWHQFSLTRSGDSLSNGYKIYLDGQFLGNSTSGTYVAPTPFAIGNSIGDTRGWPDLLDDVRIYNRDLSAEEISYYYNSSLLGYPQLLNRLDFPLLDFGVLNYIISIPDPFPMNLSHTINRNHPLVNGSVAWWLAVPELAGGRQLFDLIGPHHGTLQGNCQWEGDQLHFDGVDAYVDIGDLRAPGPVSFAFDFEAEVLNGDLLANYNVGADQAQFELSVQSDGSLLYIIQSGSTDYRGWQTNPGVISTNVRYRVAITHDGSCTTGGISFYVNGVSISFSLTLSSGLVIIPSSPGNFSIGRAGSINGSYFNGLINNIRMWRRVLSAPEVLEEYSVPYETQFNFLPIFLTTTPVIDSETIDDTITINQTITNFVIHTQNINQSLTLISSNTSFKIISRTIDDVLSINDSAQLFHDLSQVVNQSLSLTDSLVLSHIIFRTVNDTLDLTDSSSLSKILRRIVSQSLSLSSIISPSGNFSKTLTDQLSLRQIISYRAAIVPGTLVSYSKVSRDIEIIDFTVLDPNLINALKRYRIAQWGFYQIQVDASDLTSFKEYLNKNQFEPFNISYLDVKYLAYLRQTDNNIKSLNYFDADTILNLDFDIIRVN